MINGIEATNYIVFILIFIDVLAVLMFARWVVGFLKAARLRKQFVKDVVTKGGFIPAAAFEDHWVVSRTLTRKPISGFAVEGGPGCYVIKTFSHPVEDIDSSMEYDDLFIGQYTDICQCVHDRFAGKGNGDVLNAVLTGKVAFVKLVFCDADKMDETEKELNSTYRRA